MLESLLNPRHEMVRGVTAGLLRQIARSPGGHLAALRLLDGGMAAAEKAPHHCTEFFKLLSDLLSSMASAPPEVRHALHFDIIYKIFLSCPSRLFDPEEGPCRFCASLAEHFLTQSDGLP